MERQKKLGQFALSVKNKALGSNSGTAGGYLVPPELLVGVGEILHDHSLFFRLAYRQPMTSATLNVPGVNIGATHAAGVSPLLGGFTMAWGTQNVTLTESEPTLADVELKANNLQAYALISNQLLADGGEALGAYLERILAYAVEWLVDRECYVGQLPGRPLGIVYSPATVAVTRVNANDVDEIDVANMVSHLLPACFGRAVWACHPTVLAKLGSLATYGMNASFPQNYLCGILHGRPVYTTEKLNTLGTMGDLVLFDPQSYVLAERSMEIAISPHPKFHQNQSVIRIVWRGDGQTLVTDTCMLADGVTESGAFVALN